MNAIPAAVKGDIADTALLYSCGSGYGKSRINVPTKEGIARAYRLTEAKAIGFYGIGCGVIVSCVSVIYVIGYGVSYGGVDRIYNDVFINYTKGFPSTGVSFLSRNGGSGDRGGCDSELGRVDDYAVCHKGCGVILCVCAACAVLSGKIFSVGRSRCAKLVHCHTKLIARALNVSTKRIGAACGSVTYGNGDNDYLIGKVVNAKSA